jgi:glycosidase
LVVYQIYPRSFQDSDGDGLGDLRGIESRLDHLSELGVDALWLSPFYPSPQADMGYDVSDYEDVDPAFGSLEDFDRLLAAAHERGIKVLLDFVPSHTSIDHPWFREHPDWYIWSDRDGPQNNWIASFGGPAWSPDPYGRGWYLHSFYPEQPDLDWRNPEVAEAMQEAVGFWVDRGVDGFRLDALQHLLKHPAYPDNPPAREPYPLPLPDEYARLSPVYSINQPGLGEPLAALREAAGDTYLVGEVYLPSDQHAPYLEHLDQAFSFELFHSPWDAESLRAAIGDALPTTAWVLSNHDFPRLATRIGEENLRAAALLLLTLPGSAFIYQGDEIGLADGPGADPPFDRAGRDGARHPMQWDATRTGGFTDGEPWLPAVDPAARNVADQRGDPASLLTLYRELIALRGRLGDEFELLESEPGVLAYRRGHHLVAINTTGDERAAPPHGDPVLVTAPLTEAGRLPPRSGVVAHRA